MSTWGLESSRSVHGDECGMLRINASARVNYLKKMHENTRHNIERQVERHTTKSTDNKHPMIFNIGDLV